MMFLVAYPYLEQEDVRRGLPYARVDCQREDLTIGSGTDTSWETHEMPDDPTFINSFGVSLDEAVALKGHARETSFGLKGKISRLALLQKEPELGRHIGAQLYACHNILSKAGLYRSIYLSREMVDRREFHGPEWEAVLNEILCDPVAIRNRTIWLFFQSVLEAQNRFSLDLCPAPAHETLLTGQLLAAVGAACENWRSIAASLLDRLESSLELSSVDLSILGGEQATGGDFALILDVREHGLLSEDVSPDVITLTGEPRGSFVLPLVFQAKRFSGRRADVSQRHAKRGFQFNHLRQTKCASAYVFYENAKERVETPVPPMVKSADDVEPVETSAYTDVFKKTSDLATYILVSLNGSPKFPIGSSPEEALNMVLANTSPGRLSRLAVLANSAGAEERYRAALARLHIEIQTSSKEAEKPSERNGSEPEG